MGTLFTFLSPVLSWWGVLDKLYTFFLLLANSYDLYSWEEKSVLILLLTKYFHSRNWNSGAFQHIYVTVKLNKELVQFPSGIRSKNWSKQRIFRMYAVWKFQWTEEWPCKTYPVVGKTRSNKKRRSYFFFLLFLCIFSSKYKYSLIKRWKEY